MFQYQKEYLKELLGIKEYLTIEEAYEKMEAGHKVAHTSYTEDEFNFIENGIIKDEGGHHWGDKTDTPWKERVESDWAQTDWFVCDERKTKERFGALNVPYYEYNYQSANREAVFKIEGKKPTIIHIEEPVEVTTERITTLVGEKVALEARPQRRMVVENERMKVPTGYSLALENVIGIAKEFNVNKETKEKFCSLTWDYFLEDLNIIVKEVGM